MTTDSPSESLTVMLAPRGETDQVLALLVDYSAVGLLDPFIWVWAADHGRAPSTPATLVAAGRTSAVVLQEVLTGCRYERLRIATMVPADAPARQQVARSTEQDIEQVVRGSAVETPITLLRLLFTHGAPDGSEHDPALVLEGWHNLLVAPEDSAGPGLGSAPLDRLTEPVEVAQYVAPVVASVTGLWTGIDRAFFDDVAMLPGQTLRAVRSFYRELDAADAEDQLRLKLFDSNGRLPLPRGGPNQVVYVHDDAQAAQGMARALWTKHRDVLRGNRVDDTRQAPAAISARTALRLFLSFMWAALRNAPSAWLSGMLGSVSSTLATTVQHTVFGHSDSAFEVVTRDDLANWEDIGRGAEEMTTTLTESARPQQRADMDLTPLWVDYFNAALTLGDGGRRAAGIEPIGVGTKIGVLRSSAAVAPSTADAFAEIPESLAAVTGVRRVAGGDVIGAENAKKQLESTFSDGAAGIEARQAFSKLTDWAETTNRSYAAQVALVLTDFLGRARTEVGELVGRIRETADRPQMAETLRRRQQVIATVTRTAGWTVLAVVAVLLAIAAFGWVTWKFSLVVGGVTAAMYFVAALILFVLGQRHLFAALHLGQSQTSELEGMHFNLRSALQDVGRLSFAYGQLMAWNRVLGEMLRSPFGRVEPARPSRPHLEDGLPRSVQIGVAEPGSVKAESTAHDLQRQLYATGWLTRPWEKLLASASGKFGEDPTGLFSMPGIGSGSALDTWSHAVASGTVRTEGANALWTRVQEMFNAPDSDLGDALIADVLNPATGRRGLPAEFNGGVPQHRAGPAAPFEASLFTDTAATGGHSVVVLDDTAVERCGLGYRAVVVQASEGLPAYEFGMFASAPVIAAVTEETQPPESGILVF